MIPLLIAASLAAVVDESVSCPPVAELPPVVVYASRIDALARELPANVKVLESDEIERSGARDVPELLSKVVNLQIRTLNANPMQAQVAMRGFGDYAFGRIKIVVDGDELGTVDMDIPDLSSIPIDSVKRLEVLPGPSSVLYGDGAVAGVINIVTRSRDYSERNSLTVRGGSYGSFGANMRTCGGVEEDGIVYSAAFGYDRSDGYRHRSGYDLYSAEGSLCKNAENGSEMGVKIRYGDSFYEMPGALTWQEWHSDARQAAYDHDWCRTWNYALRTDFKLAIADDRWLYLDGSFSVKHRESHWGDCGYSNEYDLYGFAFSPRYVDEREFLGRENRFTVGYDFRHDSFKVTDRSGYNSPHYDFGRDRHALYVHEQLFLDDALSLVTGGRVEAVGNRWSHYRGLEESTSQSVMGDCEVGLVYRPVEELKTHVKGSCFQRSAFCDELCYTADGRQLDPESGAALDLGFDYAITGECHWDMAGYWMVMDDEIFYDPHAKDYGPGGYLGYNCNSPGHTERLGIDTALAWRREHAAEAAIRYSLVNSRFLDGEYAHGEVPLVPRHRLRAEAGIWILDGLELKGGASYVSSQFLAGDFDNVHGRLKGYPLFDAGIVYELPWVRNLKLSLVVDNLLDRDYCDYAGWSDYGGGYYYPACGRTFALSIACDF